MYMGIPPRIDAPWERVPYRRGMSAASRWWRWSRLQAINPLILNTLLAIFLGVLYVIGAAVGTLDALHPRSADALAYVLCILCAAPIVFRRRYPITALAVIAVAVTMYTFLEYPENGSPLSVLLAIYTVAAWTPWRRSIIALVATLVGASIAVSADANTIEVGGIVNNIAVFTVAYLFGYSVQARRNYVEQLEPRAADLARSRHEGAERARADARRRVPRALHGPARRTTGVVAVQSGIAAHVMDQKPDEAKRMLEAISTASRDALDEMRSLLGVLRPDADESPAADRTPQPTLDDVGGLARSITDAGVP